MTEEKFKSCPFCGRTPEITKHFREDQWQLIHRCPVMGAMCLDWRPKNKLYEIWNSRAEKLEEKKTND